MSVRNGFSSEFCNTDMSDRPIVYVLRRTLQCAFGADAKCILKKQILELLNPFTLRMCRSLTRANRMILSGLAVVVSRRIQGNPGRTRISRHGA